jgi:hypothetical protein
MPFIPGEEYVFIGKVNNFYPVNKEKNSFGHFKLGQFLGYIEFPLHGEVLPEARARFEFGMVDSAHYDNIIHVELEQKKYA